MSGPTGMENIKDNGPLEMLLHDIKKKYPVRNIWVLYYTVHMQVDTTSHFFLSLL